MSLFYVTVGYERLNLLTRFVHERLKMTTRDQDGSDRPAETIMDTLRQAIVPARRIEVEGALVGPVAHDRETVEQGNIPLLSHHPHLVRVRPDRNHGVGLLAVLQVQ